MIYILLSDLRWHIWVLQLWLFLHPGDLLTSNITFLSSFRVLSLPTFCILCLVLKNLLVSLAMSFLPKSPSSLFIERISSHCSIFMLDIGDFLIGAGSYHLSNILSFLRPYGKKLPHNFLWILNISLFKETLFWIMKWFVQIEKIELGNLHIGNIEVLCWGLCLPDKADM